MSNTRLYWLHCLSPTHVGVGRGVGYIDLPIDRDGVTQWPIIRGSAFKGVWADRFHATDDQRRDQPLLRTAFGTAGAENESNAGSLIPTDARLVCLPIRSFRGTFAWVTSPLCLKMLERTLKLAGIARLPVQAPLELLEGIAHHPQRSYLVDKEGERKIYLEDLDFQAQPCPTANGWAELLAQWVFPNDTDWQQQFKRRFVVVPDNEFDFLCDTGTEVHTRVKIDDEMKTVVKGHLWNEESLPAETILMGLIQCDRVFDRNGRERTAADKKSPQELLDHFAGKPLNLQIGGKATVGRGQVRCVFTAISGGQQ